MSSSAPGTSGSWIPENGMAFGDLLALATAAVRLLGKPGRPGLELAASNLLRDAEGAYSWAPVAGGDWGGLVPEPDPGPQADHFRLGRLLYHAATGRDPFAAPSHGEVLTAIRSVEPPPLGEVVARIPPEFELLITRCLRKNPARRYASWNEVNDILSELRADLHAGRLEGRLPAEVRRGGRKLGRELLIIVLLALAAIYVWWKGPPPAPPAPQPGSPSSGPVK